MQGITTSKDGKIYIADGHRIRRIDIITGIIQSIVGKGNNHHRMNWRPPQFFTGSKQDNRFGGIYFKMNRPYYHDS